MPKQAILRWSLLAGALYFLAISIVHLLGIKIPGLYVFYNVPSTQYQDSIISFLAFGWAAFFYATALIITQAPAIAPTIFKLLMAAVLVALLSLVNIVRQTDFAAIGGLSGPEPYYLQIGLLTIYAAWLIYLALNLASKRRK